MLPSPSGAVELGYWIVPSQWGKGFATEAARAVIALAQGSLRLTRIVASHILDNKASATVLRNLGFVDTGEVVMHESRASGRAGCRFGRSPTGQ